MRITTLLLGTAVAASSGLASFQTASAQERSVGREQLRRGRYLATFGGCSDCHTPKLMTSKGPVPDPARLLSGHPADAPPPAVPPGAIGPNGWGALASGDLTAGAGPWAVSFAANLTPDKASGLGSWTFEQFSRTMRTGKHLGVARDLLPPMPWFDVAVLNDRDLRALFAYPRSLKPIANQEPAPIPPNSKQMPAPMAAVRSA